MTAYVVLLNPCRNTKKPTYFAATSPSGNCKSLRKLIQVRSDCASRNGFGNRLVANSPHQMSLILASVTNGVNIPLRM